MTITLPTPTSPATPNGQQRRPMPAPGGLPPRSLTPNPGGAPATTPSGSPTPPDPAAAAATAAQNDATALITSELSSWGFGQDAINWVTSEIQGNKGVDQILSDLRSQPFYVNSIFGQTNAARQKNGLADMNEAQILAYQDYAIGDLNQAGLPKGFFSQSELVGLMGSDVSTAELDARITQGYVAALKADPATKAALQNYYGVTDAGLAAYYLDPNKALPLLQQQFVAAQVGGAATMTGYGNIDKVTAQNLAAQGLTESTAQTGFNTLAKEHNIFNPLPGSAQQPITQQMQLAAEFGGNAQDQAAITQATDQRTASFKGNYKFAEQAGRGITGLGPSPQNG